MFIELYAKWRAKRKYRFKELFEAEIADLQAGLSESRANEKAALASKLRIQAGAIENNIKVEEQTPEYKALEGQELYEANQDKKKALNIAAENHRQAEQEIEESKASMDAAKMFRRQAAAGRETAERLRNL